MKLKGGLCTLSKKNIVQNDCLVCGEHSMHPSSTYSGLILCEGCSFLTADICLSEDKAEQLYGRDYFHGQEYSDYIRDKAIIQRNFSRKLHILEKYMEDSHKKLLEIGCAYGFFMELIKDKYPQSTGVDISADAIDYAVNTLKVNAHKGNFLDIEMKQYDVCCMWDTIEHVSAAGEFISKISSEISPNGLLALTTGDIGSLNARIRKSKWRQIHPPTHLHYFSVPTISKLLERNGFRVLHVSHPGNLMNVQTALYIMLVIKQGRTRVFNAISRFVGKGWCVPVNLFDTMYVIARKQ